jgi:translin
MGPAPDSTSPTRPGPGGTELVALIEQARRQLEGVNGAREIGLAACRRAIRAASSSIRAVHRVQPELVVAFRTESEAAIRDAQRALAPYPMIAFAGFLHDAEKEYAEAVLTSALVDGEPIPDYQALAVGLPAWLNGLAEAASELRRHLLDRLRAGETSMAERLLASMEDVYDALVAVDYPDAVTGGLRRTADSLRAVLERTRSDVTTTLLQVRLQYALERRAAEEGTGGPALA